MTAIETRFIADKMLGTLARWLRLLGYDTTYPDSADDLELIDMAKNEDRILLTRDKEMTRRKECRDIKLVLIVNANVEKQVGEVFSSLGIEPNRKMLLTRCSVCNSKIEEIKKDDAESHVPAGVFERNDKFWKCPGCSRFYWMGTHWEKIMASAGKLGQLNQS
jgi:uncharacterized protein with PIN domain